MHCVSLGRWRELGELFVSRAIHLQFFIFDFSLEMSMRQRDGTVATVRRDVHHMYTSLG